MQALVKTPRTDIRMRGEIPPRVLEVLRNEYGAKLRILEEDEEIVNNPRRRHAHLSGERRHDPGAAWQEARRHPAPDRFQHGTWQEIHQPRHCQEAFRHLQSPSQPLSRPVDDA